MYAGYNDICGEISSTLLTMDEPTSGKIRSEIKRICAKYSLNKIPRNHEILATVPASSSDTLRRLLVKKPAKTASGVAVIALMPMPFACPHGRCTYCPGGVSHNTPNSYTASEPAALNAIANSYDPKRQILTKLDKLQACGHDTSKTELVIVGGTFLFMPKEYQTNFVKSCYEALNGHKSPTLQDAQDSNSSSPVRNVGLTIETKPDFCKREHVDTMLEYGATRIEIGLQTLHNKIYRIVNRGHTYADVTESFQIAKDSGYKIVSHMMPGLPTMTPEQDIADFGRLFTDSDLKPDMLKIYPSLVIRDTPLYRDYVSGKYRPYSHEEMIHVLTEAKKMVPPWVRIMRVQREISPDEIVAGPKSGNLRQIVLDRLKSQGAKCRCIRCREIRLKKCDMKNISLRKRVYDSSGGQETFLSYEDESDSVYGFLRLRKPWMPHRREITQNSCIIRELHVYGRTARVGKRAHGQVQHSGLGRRLVREAERLSQEEYDARKILVISAVGTKPYYGRLGYKNDGPYMSKELK